MFLTKVIVLKVWFITGKRKDGHMKATQWSFIFGHDNKDNWIYGPDYPVAVINAIGFQEFINRCFILGPPQYMPIFFASQVSSRKFIVCGGQEELNGASSDK